MLLRISKISIDSSSKKKYSFSINYVLIEYVIVFGMILVMRTPASMFISMICAKLMMVIMPLFIDEER